MKAKTHWSLRLSHIPASMPWVIFRRSWLCHGTALALVPQNSKERTCQELNELCVQVLPSADKVSQWVRDNLPGTPITVNTAAKLSCCLTSKLLNFMQLSLVANHNLEAYRKRNYGKHHSQAPQPPCFPKEEQILDGSEFPTMKLVEISEWGAGSSLKSVNVRE